MKTALSFCNLKHNDHACRAIGYGIAQVASYAIKHLEDRVDAKFYQIPSDFTNYLGQVTPTIACFSSFVWNSRLSYDFATRIKEAHPNAIIVFGGPHYPLLRDEQEAYLRAHPNIDFYIFREGEQAFVDLFNQLSNHQFSAS
jgi:radical SAM superfamily enzyme YgiQ (UPF0313 family)